MIQIPKVSLEIKQNQPTQMTTPKAPRKEPKMKLSKSICALTLSVALVCGTALTGCTTQEQVEEPTPDFSGYTKVADLATLECSYHNVAEIYNNGTDLIFGLVNVGYKKAWFEYDGSVTLGVDVSKVKIEGPDENNVVTITIPKAQVIGTPDADVSTFSEIYTDEGSFAQITSVDQTQAYQTAQEEMRESAENNADLMNQAQTRAKTLLSKYVQSVGESVGKNYEVKFVDATDETTTSSEN
jgi:hypothetical protein